LVAGELLKLLRQSYLPDGHAGKSPVNYLAQKYSYFQNFGFGAYPPRSAPSKGRIAIAVNVARNVVDGSVP
jgi:hypothetical protein